MSSIITALVNSVSSQWTELSDNHANFSSKSSRSSSYMFCNIELHQADGVMRQFRFRQNIPNDPLNLDQLHKEYMRGRTDWYWPHYHATWIQM